MALTKEVYFTQSITELGHVQVLRVTRILEDDVELAKSNHRHVVDPGDDVSNEDEQTKLIAGVVHTPACVAKYKQKKKEGSLDWKYKKK